MSKETVKLVPNDVVKGLLKEAKRSQHNIEVDDSSFMVRDNITNGLVFRGIKIRNNCWGITFIKNDEDRSIKTTQNDRTKDPDYPSPADSVPIF